MNSIRHSNWYEFWRANKRNLSETAREYSRSQPHIAKCANEEDWIAHADQDDAADAARFVQTHDQHKAAALTQAHQLVEDMLLNARAMQLQLRHYPTAGKQQEVGGDALNHPERVSIVADAMDIGAAGSYAAKAVAAADTLYSISKLNVDVTDNRERADITAIRERLQQRMAEGAQA